ncbi:20291_t:CDS:2, partial [Entrophospora sp. SA101]
YNENNVTLEEIVENFEMSEDYLKDHINMIIQVIPGWIWFTWDGNGAKTRVKIDNKNYKPEEIYFSINKKKEDIKWWHQQSINLDYYSSKLFIELEKM